MQVSLTYDTERDEGEHVRAVHATEMTYVLYHVREAAYRVVKDKMTSDEFIAEIWRLIDSPTIDVVLDTYL